MDMINTLVIPPYIHFLICAAQQLFVMVDHLRVSNQTGELKNVKHDWKYISVRF